MNTFREAFPIITVDDVDRAVDFYRMCTYREPSGTVLHIAAKP